MRGKTIAFGIILTLLVPLIVYFIGVGKTTYLIGGIFIIKGLMIIFIPKEVKKIDKFINIDRWEAFQKKDSEFKLHVEKGSIAYILIGLGILFLGYRFETLGINNKLFPYYLAYGAFVAIYFFGETFSVIKSKDLDEYRRFNVYVSIALIVVAILIL